MLVVSTKPAEPTWRPVMGAEVLFAPIDRPMLRRARRAALASLGREEGEAADEASAAEQLEEIGDALSYQLIVAGAQDWRGVVQIVVNDEGDPIPGEDGKPQVSPLPFTRAALDAGLSDPISFEAFDAVYVREFSNRERERAAPGKDSPLSPDGTGPKVKEERDTAPSPVMASAADATSAPTGSTKRKPRPKKPSGTS